MMCTIICKKLKKNFLLRRNFKGDMKKLKVTFLKSTRYEGNAYDGDRDLL